METSNLSAKFIVLDGTEGCGKSTQTQLLRDRLIQSGIPALLVRDPGTTRIGERIRQILLDKEHTEMSMRCEMLLYMAARAQLMSQLITPALESGKLVISDRFVSSTLAYQLGGEDLTGEEIREVAEVAVQGRWPDLTIILDIPAEQSLARVQREKDRIEQRPLEYHEMVRQNFRVLASIEPQRYRLIRADRDIATIHEEIWQIIQTL